MNQITPFPSEAARQLPSGRVLVLAPHPDDEIFGCGGAILKHLQQKDPVQVVVVTDGALPVNELQKTPEYPQQRKQETLAAAEILGYGQPHFLDFKDGFLEANEALISQLYELILEYKPHNLYLPSDNEIHADHLAVHRAGIAAATRISENIHLIFYEIGQPLRPNFFLDITDLQPILEQAMECFASQLAVQDYKNHIRSLHAYRSYTLGKEVMYAEAYLIRKSDELKSGDMLWQNRKPAKETSDRQPAETKSYPLISVIVRTMNRPELPEALASIALQTYPNLEVIVVDARGEVPLNLGDRCGRFPLRIITQNHPLSRPEAANAGLDAVKGDFFCFLDDDDLFLEDHLMNLYATQAKSKALVTYDVIEKVDSVGSVVRFQSPFDLMKLFWGNYIPNLALLYNSILLEEGIRFDTSLDRYEDWDFVLQAAQYGNFVFVPEFGGIYRDKGSSGVFLDKKTIQHFRESIYRKWIPKLEPPQIASILLSFDYQHIYELEEIQRIREDYLAQNKEMSKLRTDYSTLQDIKDHLDTEFLNLKSLVDRNEFEIQSLRKQNEEWMHYKRSSRTYKIAKGISKFAILFRPKDFIAKQQANRNLRQLKSVVERSGMFDVRYYLLNYPDVKDSKMSAIKHYLHYGGFEGRNPSPGFESRYYLETYPDVKESGMNPLVHYLLHGKSENRTPIPTPNKTDLKPYRPTDHHSTFEGHSQIPGKRILFIAHDLYPAGAEILLLYILEWMHKHTAHKLFTLVLEHDDKRINLAERYSKVAEVYFLDGISQGGTGEELYQKIKTAFGKVDLIYANTIVSAQLLDIAGLFQAPAILHIHELEVSIQKYTTIETRRKMVEYPSVWIPCSTPVRKNLHEKHGISPERLKQVDAFIQVGIEYPVERDAVRKKLGLPLNTTIVWGCGTGYWRKGPDLFIQTANALKKVIPNPFLFCWIGEMHWDADHNEWGYWKKWEDYMDQHGLLDCVHFLGHKEQPRDYFTAGDIFYLPSREDPYPMVCLEAAECGLPIVCFEDAGGMPDFVRTDAGIVVPYLDTEAAAIAIQALINDKNRLKALGETGRSRLLNNHSDQIAVPQVLNICRSMMKIDPVVSVIVPVYNHAPFLNQRLDSILHQTFRDFEIIILDDASTDDSLKKLRDYEHRAEIRVIENRSNSGSPFRQWEKGIALSKGKYIWIAEGDDFADPDFLGRLLPRFNDDSVALAYCNSHIVNEHNEAVDDYRTYYESLHFNHWKYPYQATAEQEINYGLGIKNTIPNASGVLIRKDAIPANLFDQLHHYQFAGDWLFYIEILKGHHIAYIPEKLNYHRKHSLTLTTQYNHDEQKKMILLKEIALIHSRILELYAVNPFYYHKWEHYIREQIGYLKPSASSSDCESWYPFQTMSNKLQQICNSTQSEPIRWVFLTTNDGSPVGGSEKLWQQTAIALSEKERAEVWVIIKKWVPEPTFIAKLSESGVNILYKDELDFKSIVRFNPQMMIISIGDQDEGIAWYEQCRANGIPYVIVNHLTKEPEYWPVNSQNTEQLITGYQGARMVLFTGNNNHRVMEKRLGMALTNTGVFYNPLDVDREIRIPFPPSTEGLQIAMVGNLMKIHKAQHLAIAMFATPKWRKRKVHLNIYGKGQDEETLQQLARNLELDNVTFHGYCTDIPSIWAKNHAILITSMMEGLPLVLTAAMMCARVPIVTNIGAHSEVITDEVSGFIAPYPTVEDIDRAMEKAYHRRDEWERIGSMARYSILQHVPADPIGHFLEQLKYLI